jgi:hypothetical protein
MEKCSASNCVNQAVGKVDQNWFCSQHMKERQVADAVAAGGLILCETCLTQLTHKDEEIRELLDAGTGPCPKCDQTGQLRVVPRGN